MNNSDYRFAVYLIPPHQIAWSVTEVHQMLRKQFGFVAASRFQVHATIKGFFKKANDPLSELNDRLDVIFSKQRPFPVHFNGFHIEDIGIGLNISRIGDTPNSEMLALDRKSTRLNSSHTDISRMPSSA